MTSNHILPSHPRLCSLSVASYDSQGLRWKYSNPPPRGVVFPVRYELNLYMLCRRKYSKLQTHFLVREDAIWKRIKVIVSQKKKKRKINLVMGPKGRPDTKTNWPTVIKKKNRPALWSSGLSSWIHNGDVLRFLWGTNWIYICYVEESIPPLWSSGQSSWLHNGDVLRFLWGTNGIYICYVEESSSG
jgi:hypothetical protein